MTKQQPQHSDAELGDLKMKQQHQSPEYRSDEETSHTSGSNSNGSQDVGCTTKSSPVKKSLDKSAAQTKAGHSSKDEHDNINNTNVLCPAWTRLTDRIHRSIGRFVIALSMWAARNPTLCITGTVSLSLALLAIGYNTNFYVNVEAFELYAPFGSIPQEHRYWTLEQSGFPERKRAVTLIVHNNGENMLSKSIETMEKVFEAMDTVRGTDGYTENCEDGNYWDTVHNEYTCRIISPTRAWYHNYGLFQTQVHSDQDLIEAVSASEYPGGEPVNHEYIMGNLINDENGTITYAPAYFVYLVLVNKGDETKELETRITERLLALQAEWDNNNIGTDREIHLDFFTARTRSDEFSRAIQEDLYLVALIFLVMSAFTCLVFYKSDRVQSRCMLGLGSVFTIGMSLCTGFGILFIFGVPFTSMTQLIPFLLFGVGLDDTFIITGAFLRTDPSHEPEERIREAMQEVGSSISLTTITTVTAFLLGLSSSVPAIYWVCLYAFPTIIIDFIYQITLFVAILVIDERRVRANRADCMVCFIKVHRNDSDEEEGDNQGTKNSKHIADRVMAEYGKLLLRPASKIAVVLIFVAFLGLCIYRASMLTQEFDFKELFPEGSYATSAFNALEKYNDKTLPLSITFRDTNQSDPYVQAQMKKYIEEVTELPAFHETPPFCWVRDFDRFDEIGLGDVVANMTFNEKVDFALSHPSLKQVYGDDIARDEEGNIIASRCTILVSNSAVEDVEGMIDLLMEQREVTTGQAINHGRQREAFFTYSDIYLFWEFYSIAVDELILTTILNITAVTVIAFIFIPHFSAALFILPLIISVNINLLGVIQMAGLHINAVTYVCLVISIGLIVDFLMHIILRYNESRLTTREARVKETLETMGASILLGGLSTFLGAFPLAFSTSVIIRTVFTCFCSMVVLGVTHGLILLPVLLAVVGPIPKPGAPTIEQEPQDEKTAIFSEFFCDTSSSSIDGNSNGQLSPCQTVETELDDTVEDFLVAVAEEISQYECPNDKSGAQKGKEELIRLYSSIYSKSIDPEAFIQQLVDEVKAKKQLVDEVNAKKRPIIECSC